MDMLFFLSQAAFAFKKEGDAGGLSGIVIFSSCSIHMLERPKKRF